MSGRVNSAGGRRRGYTYLSFIHIIEPLQQLDHSTLATPTGTHQGHCLANFHFQTHVV